MARWRAEQSRASEIAVPSTSHFNCRYDEEGLVGERTRKCADYRFADDEELAATLVSAGVAAILTSTSLTGFSVQAWVT
jgi:hypothetical protein